MDTQTHSAPVTKEFHSSIEEDAASPALLDDSQPKEQGLSVADAPDYAKRSCNSCLGRGTVQLVVDRYTNSEEPCACATRRYDRERLSRFTPEQKAQMARVMYQFRVNQMKAASALRKKKAKAAELRAERQSARAKARKS